LDKIVNEIELELEILKENIKTRGWLTLLTNKGENYCFVNELIQNAIDSYTQTINIEIKDDYISFQDYGEGMDLDNLKNDLLSFPKTTKKNNFLSIGYKGIGFLTSLSEKSKGVIVETGKMGKSYRVLIDSTGNYEIFSLTKPVNGTKITIFLKSIPSDFENQVKTIIHNSCKHLSIPVYLNNENLTEPFKLEHSIFSITIKTVSTSILIGYSLKNHPLLLYNKGIHVGKVENPYPNLEIKIDSPYTKFNIMGVANQEHLDYILEKIKKIAIPQLQKEYFYQLNKLALNDETGEYYKKYLKIIDLTFIHDFPVKYFKSVVFKSINNKLYSISTILENRIFYFSNKPISTENRKLIVFDKNFVDRYTIKKMFSGLNISKEIFCEDFEKSFLEFEKFSPPDDSFHGYLSKALLKYIKKILNLKTKKILFGKIKGDLPYYPVEQDENIINLKKLNKKSFEKSEILLINISHPSFKNFSKKNIKNVWCFSLLIIRSLLLFLKIEPDDKTLFEISLGIKTSFEKHGVF
jgi:Histidine kinase-, DNA gyrase B-, and HSP90-like ATPase